MELYRLEVKTALNTSQEDVISNLRSSKERGLPTVELASEGKDKPLIICASGPSAKEFIKLFPRDGYDLMALNGAYNALLDEGIVADLYAQLDARECNLPFVQRAKPETKFYLASQVHPTVFDALRSFNVTTFHLNTETTARVYGEETGLYIGCLGGTIGMAALALAGVLGYRTLVLLGYDSSYKDGESHWKPQPQNAGQGTIQVEFMGRWYTTTPALADQTMQFFEWNKALHEAFPGLEVHISGEGLFYDYILLNQNAAAA